MAGTRRHHQIADRVQLMGGKPRMRAHIAVRCVMAIPSFLVASAYPGYAQTAIVASSAPVTSKSPIVAPGASISPARTLTTIATPVPDPAPPKKKPVAGPDKRIPVRQAPLHIDPVRAPKPYVVTPYQPSILGAAMPSLAVSSVAVHPNVARFGARTSIDPRSKLYISAARAPRPFAGKLIGETRNAYQIVIDTNRVLARHTLAAPRSTSVAEYPAANVPVAPGIAPRPERLAVDVRTSHRHDVPRVTVNAAVVLRVVRRPAFETVPRYAGTRMYIDPAVAPTPYVEMPLSSAVELASLPPIDPRRISGSTMVAEVAKVRVRGRTVLRVVFSVEGNTSKARPSTATVDEPIALAGTIPAIAPGRTTSPMTPADTSIPTADPSATAPTIATRLEATDFIVFTVGEEELAPVLVVPGPNGPFVPIADFAALIGAVYQVKDASIFFAMQAADPLEAQLSVTTLRGTRKQKHRVDQVKLTDGDLLFQDGQWYAGVGALRELSALDVSYDRRSQSVVVASPRNRLPRYAAVDRREQRSMQYSAGSEDFIARGGPVAGAAMANSAWFPTLASLTYAFSKDNASGAWTGQGTFGASVLHGGLSVSGSAWSGQAKAATPDMTWLGGSPMSRWLTQARVGFGAATGIAPVPGNGISLTNAPFSRPIGLGTLPVSGLASPGAEIEIASGGKLLGVVTADAAGNWTSPVPVGFGQNLLEISTFGPQGVTRRTSILSLDGEHLPGGRFEYGVSAQRSRRDPATCLAISCGDMANVDLRWGVTPRLTIRAGASGLAPLDSLRRRAAWYGTVVAAPTSWLQLRHEQSGSGWMNSRVSVQPSLAFRADVVHEQFGSNQQAVPFWQAQRSANFREQSWASLTVRPVPNDLSRAWLSAYVRNVSGYRLNTQQLSTVVGGRFSGTLLNVGLDRTVARPTDYAAATTNLRLTSQLTIPQLRVGPRWLATSFFTLGSSMLLHVDKVPTLSTGLTTSVFRTLLMQVATDWHPGTRPSLRIQLQQRTKAAMLLQSVSSDGVGSQPFSASSSVLGSVLLPLDGRAPTFTGDLVALRARVRVLAFLDLNENGLRDIGEPPVTDLPTLVGTQKSVTDADGVAIVQGLPILEAIPVRSEQSVVQGQDGGNFVMSGVTRWARLVAYGETVVLLPFVAASQVTVELDPASAAGRTVWVTPLDRSADPVAPQWPFRDGTVLLGALAPGRYRLEGRRAGDAFASGSWGTCVLTVARASDMRVQIPEEFGSKGDRPCRVIGAAREP